MQFAPLLAAQQPGGSPEEGETETCCAALLYQPSDLSLATLGGLCEPAEDRKSLERKAPGVGTHPNQNPVYHTRGAQPGGVSSASFNRGPASAAG